MAYSIRTHYEREGELGYRADQVWTCAEGASAGDVLNDLFAIAEGVLKQVVESWLESGLLCGHFTVPAGASYVLKKRSYSRATRPRVVATFTVEEGVAVATETS